MKNPIHPGLQDFLVLRSLFCAKNVPFYGSGVLPILSRQILPLTPPSPTRREGEEMEREGEGMENEIASLPDRNDRLLCNFPEP